MNVLRQVCCGFLMAVPVLLGGQQAAPVEDGGIQLVVVVTDKTGKPVPGLEAKDFTVKDTGRAVKISSFHAVDGSLAGAPPTKVVLVLDAVNMGLTQAAFARTEMVKYLRQNGGHLAYPVSIYLFGNQGTEMHRRCRRTGMRWRMGWPRRIPKCAAWLSREANTGRWTGIRSRSRRWSRLWDMRPISRGGSC